jgi:outer membrane protein assembly factor BamD (BamD/ComL family)
MAYRIKVPPRTLPVDEAHLVSSLEHNLQDYRWPLLVGAGLLILVGGIVWGVMWYDASNTRKAQDLEREATLHYLTRPANDPQKTDLNLKEAITLYQRVVDEFPRTPTAPLALFSLGNAYLQKNEVDSAIGAYQRFLANYGGNVALLGLVQQKLGYSYLLKGDREKAMKAYAAILEIPGSLNRDSALFELGRLEEDQSQLDKALTHFQDLIKTYPNSPFASEAAIRVRFLEAQKSPNSSPASSAPAVTPSTPPKTPAKP